MVIYSNVWLNESKQSKIWQAIYHGAIYGRQYMVEQCMADNIWLNKSKQINIWQDGWQYMAGKIWWSNIWQAKYGGEIYGRQNMVEQYMAGNIWLNESK